MKTPTPLEEWALLTGIDDQRRLATLSGEDHPAIVMASAIFPEALNVLALLLTILNRSQELGETIPDIVCPGIHHRREHTVAILNRLKDGSDRHFRPAILLVERHGFKQHMTRHAFELKGVDEAFGRLDRVIHAVEPILISVRIVLDESPYTARPHVHLVNRRRKDFRPPP